jgi:hypothetical protein
MIRWCCLIEARELAFLQPELFSGVAILAGGGLGSAAAPLEVTYPKINDAPTFNTLVTRIFIAVGEQDNHTAGLQNNAKRLKDSLDKLGIASTFELTTGGTPGSTSAGFSRTSSRGCEPCRPVIFPRAARRRSIR